MGDFISPPQRGQISWGVLLMVQFHGGPAHLQAMSFRRFPDFLRVVQCGDKFDVLDQINDTARDVETVSVYKLRARPTIMHVKAAASTGISGFHRVGNYDYYPYQPMENQMRNNERWQQWCGDEVRRNMLCVKYGIPMLPCGGSIPDGAAAVPKPKPVPAAAPAPDLQPSLL